MGTLKIKGQTSGSVSLKAPDTGSDAILTLPGTTGELLPLAGGKILQIVRETDTTQRQTTSTSYVDASISVTITPQKSNSAVILIWSFNIGHFSTSNYAFTAITDSSNNVISGSESVIGSNTTTDFYVYNTLIGYATPATTSPVTYKGRFRVSSSGTININEGGSRTGQLYAIEVSA